MTYPGFKAWPSWRYGPNGEAEIFEKAEDVPKGWQDHPSKFKRREKGEVEKEDDGDADLGGLTREQIIGDLQRRNVSFKETETDRALYRKLLKAIEAQS